MAKYVNHIWAVNPDLLFFLPPEISSFLPYALNINLYPYAPPINDNRIRIVHAPTNREAKGTDLILKSLNRLKEKYPNTIEIILVENMEHSKALEVFKTADIVIDQILIGWYGTISAEVMMLGKVVVARIDEDLLRFVPPLMAEEIKNTLINADPFTLDIVLEELIQDKKILEHKGRISREFSLRWHDFKKISQITINAYQDTKETSCDYLS
jgi:glycosyltransferase involved in cell wall biosynthesis